MFPFPILDSEEGFLGLPTEDAASAQDAKVVIVPFGVEKTVSYSGGTKQGPAAILEASHQVELFDEDLWCEPFREYGVVTLKEFPLKPDLEASLVQLEKIIEELLDLGKFPMTLGGEHSLTAGSIRPFAKRNKKLNILHFDAHADLRDGYAGEHYSHAAALRRCMDHENINLVSCGIRNISAGEIPFLEANRDRIHIFWGKDRDKWNVEEIVGKLIPNVPVYLTFDLDGFDASLMQATGTPEPGGVMWNDAMNIIRLAAKRFEIIGADVVELAPIEGFHGYDFLAAKLVYKILNYTFLRDRIKV